MAAARVNLYPLLMRYHRDTRHPHSPLAHRRARNHPALAERRQCSISLWRQGGQLDAFISGRPENCHAISLDQYGRTVATCSVDGVDLGEWQVSDRTATASALRRACPAAQQSECSQAWPVGSVPYGSSLS